jgi:hypothetical protein
MTKDYRLLLSRLRPTSAYHDTGADGYAGIGEWRDPSTTKPTQAEFDAEDTAYQAELAKAVTAKNNIITTAQGAVGVTLANLTAAQIKALLACLLYQAGGVDIKTMQVKPLGEWLR